MANPTERATALKLNNPGFLDALSGPYDSIAAACAAIPDTVKDGVNFRLGKVPVVRISGKLVPYWWPEDDFSDNDLQVYIDLQGVEKENAVIKAVAGISALIPANMELTGFTWVEDVALVYETGNTTNNSSSGVTSNISVVGGKEMCITASFWSAAGLAFYNSQGVYISGIGLGGDTPAANDIITKTFITPQNAASLRATIRDAARSQFSLIYTADVIVKTFELAKTGGSDKTVAQVSADIATVAGAVVAEAANRQEAVQALLGTNTEPTQQEIVPGVDIASFTSNGGANNQGAWNNFDYPIGKPIVGMRFNSTGAQTFKSVKLGANGTTKTDHESHTVSGGVSLIMFTNPVVLSAEEKLGPQCGGVNIRYLSGGIGSRVQNQAGTWSNVALTWGYTLLYIEPADDLTYSTVKEISVKLDEIDQEGVSDFADRPAGGIEKFEVSVNVAIPDYSGADGSLKDSRNMMTDISAVWIPETYTKGGTPTRLVIYSHGAGSAVNYTRTNITLHPLLTYLQQKEYAILDTNGYPEALWSEGEEANKCAHMGGWVGVQCTIKAYEYVVKKYNIATDGVILAGTSMGGLTSSNLLANSGIPAMIHILEAPITDLFGQAWGKPWFSGAKGTRYQLAKFYGFTDYNSFDFAGATAQQLQDYWDANKDRVTGFDPANWQAQTIGGIKQKYHKVPLLIFHSTRDTTSLPSFSSAIVSSIRAGGGLADVRLIDVDASNQHAPMSFDIKITDEDGILVNILVREAYLRIKRFDR